MKRRTFVSGMAAAGLAPLVARLNVASAATGAVELSAGPATAHLMGADKPETPAWLFNGMCPGPELRLRQGEEARIRLVNGLDQPTTVHWHGLRIANAMDGVPNLTQDPVAPGESFEYAFTPPDAGTFWYHTHTRSSEQMGRGLYGPLIVEERETLNFARDQTLVLDDWRLNDDGTIQETFGHLHDAAHDGRLGNWLTVNGVSLPEIEIAHGATSRVRLVNACNARVLFLTFRDTPATVIALDGQPTPPQPLEGRSFVLAPGQRIDIFFDNDLPDGEPITLSEVSQGDAVAVAMLVPRAVSFLDLYGGGRFEGLPANPPLAEPDLEAALNVPLEMTGGAMGGLAEAVYQGETKGIRELAEIGKVWAFNGVVGMAEEPLFRAKRGQTVLIDMHNDTAWPHAMHIHGHHFRTVSFNGEALTGQPWRDTVLSNRNDRTGLAFVADNPGKWLIHCHMLEHHDAGMVSWFEVEA